MYCPRCAYEQKCPCEGPACGAKDGWIDKGNGMQACFKCGLTKDINWWADLECEIYMIREIKK